MLSAPTPEDERQRLDALRELNLLDTPPEERFERLTRLAARLFRVPVTLVSLVDADRQWFKSRYGLEVCETNREVSFCAHAIANDELLVVPDARCDPRFADNPLVTGKPHIVFYAGCPVRTPNGLTVGTLCLIDHVPHELDEGEQACLRDLAHMVEQELSPIAALRNDSSGAAESLMWPGYIRRLLSRLALTRTLAALGTRPAAAIAAMAVTALLLAGVSAWDSAAGTGHRAEIQHRLVEHLNLHRGQLEAALRAGVQLAQALAGFVDAQGSMDERPFKRFASQLSADLPGIRSLQLAPDGKVRHLFPLAGNEHALGYDLFAAPALRSSAVRAVQEGRTVIVGPVPLRQGSTGLIVATPVFTDAAGANGERFWGFALAVIDYPSLLAEAGFPKSEHEVRYAMREQSTTGPPRMLFGDATVFEGEPVTTSVALIAGSWELAALPEGGWPTQWPQRAAVLTLGPTLSVLLGLLAYFLLRLPSRLRLAFNEAVQALERSELRFRDAIEALPDGFVVYDAHDRLVLCNENYRRLYSDSAPAIREGNSFEAIIRYGFTHGQYADEDGELPLEERVRRRVLQHRRAEGAVEQCLSDGRWLRIVERRMRDGGRVGFRVDITELKSKELELQEARERAEQANAAKSAFLATVSHEVRTPLNGVLGLLGLLREQPLDGKLRRYVDTAYLSGQQLLAILNDLLDVSKLEAGRLELEPVPSALDDVIEGALTLVRPDADRKGLALAKSCGEDVPSSVVADPGRLRQVLLNLLDNAVKFTAAGNVRLTVTRVGGEPERPLVRFEVNDTGVGVRDEEVACLFDRFTQADASISRRHGGTGLGLSICKHLVELMGGRIGACSNPHGGARFWFEVALQRCDSAGPSRSDATEAAAVSLPRDVGREPVRVLLAEDSPTNQMVLKAMLADTGYQVDIVGDGREAVAAAESLPYDLVLMDIAMPEMDGLEATARIRALPGRERIPIIALTANAMAGDEERFLAAGMDDYLAKPLRKALLLRTLARWAGLQ